jgi:hypothetical protein
LETIQVIFFFCQVCIDSYIHYNVY